MKYFLFLLCWCLPQLLLALPLKKPLQIAERFVAKEQWPEMRSYLSGEVLQQAKQQSLGQQIPPQLQRRCQLLQQDSASAVVTVELRDTVSRNDFYLYFAKEESTWKLRAVRGLAMTGVGQQMLEVLTTMPASEVAQYDQRHPAAPHAFTVGNLKLWIGADATIIEHFKQNQAEFKQVVDLVQARQYFPPRADVLALGEQAANADPAISQILQSLFISRITRRDTGCGTCLEFLIGGLVENTVGLLYQPDAKAVPAINPDSIIVIKPIGNGWYLYKTT
ncbi:hypothetical protein [Hymenobacter sp. GOD-10R]|uniref:hypothetical protein n=1 Tax=Hymenobacter sp. GOD-10R TaxID=3093922 RepID=UPI002D76D75B|nr:hypothetical protein [Hymenobacter sp. GOD-10R]WRQ30058.1 hypothetical protein SD425_07265 [Hymenobacter sp. GOD-10R]